MLLAAILEDGEKDTLCVCDYFFFGSMGSMAVFFFFLCRVSCSWLACNRTDLVLLVLAILMH
jgi:hypothetical protein